MIKSDLNFIFNSLNDWDKFASKTILVTGANGFLPAYMIETLLNLNETFLQNSPCKIIALVKNFKHAKIRFSNYLKNKNFSLLIQDVSNKININKNTNINYIIHAASPASPKFYNDDPLSVSLPNILGTINTLELAKENELDGYLYFSSGEIYGDTSSSNIIDENSYGSLSSLSLRSCYAESKRMGENLCISYANQYKIPVKIVRPFHTYGPGMKLDDGRVFADFVSDIINNRNIVIKSDGSTERPFCYLADATVAFFKILLYGENNNAYNVANPYESFSIIDLAQLLVEIFSQKKIKVEFSNHDQKYLKTKVKKYIVDISKIKKLNWTPLTSIKDGFIKTVKSYEN